MDVRLLLPLRMIMKLHRAHHACRRMTMAIRTNGTDCSDVSDRRDISVMGADLGGAKCTEYILIGPVVSRLFSLILT